MSTDQTATHFVRVCIVYFSAERDTALVAPMFNHAGLFAEQPGAVGEARAHDDAALGAAVRDALARCAFEPEFNYSGKKRTDWPAYRASGCRSVREFEQRFAPILVQGANASNLVAIVDSPGFGEFELHLQASVPFHAPPADLGRCVRYVWSQYREATPRVAEPAQSSRPALDRY
jgi:hypothetical protein